MVEIAKESDIPVIYMKIVFPNSSRGSADGTGIC